MNHDENNEPKEEDFEFRNNEHARFDRMKRRHGGGPSWWRAIIGIFILFIGVLFLGNNTGFFYIPISYFFQVFWPLFIIFIGLSMVGRSTAIAQVLGVLAILITLAAMCWFFWSSRNYPQQRMMFKDFQHMNWPSEWR